MSPLKRALIIVAFLAVLCFVALYVLLREFEELDSRSPPPAAEAAPCRVEFDDGTPAAGARVVVEPAGDGLAGDGLASDTADAAALQRGGSLPVGPDGVVRLEDLERLTGAGGGRAIHAALGPLVSESTGEARAGTILRLPPAFDLAGRVQRAGDRAAVWGASVRCAEAETVTNADGTFRLRGVPAGVLRETDVSVHVAAPGYEPLRWPLPRGEAPPFYGDLTLLLRAAD